MAKQPRQLTPKVPGQPGAEGDKPPTATTESGVEVAAANPQRLPEPHEVDPTKITRAVLTTQGYVVPA